MMRRLAALCVLLAGPAYGASFYISTTGSDTNGCTNQTTDACASFPRCAAVMSAGDTCYLLDGTYNTWDTSVSYPNGGWVIEAPAGGTSTSARKRFTSLSQDATKVTVKRAYPASVTKDTWGIVGSATPGSLKGDYYEFDHIRFEGRAWTVANVDGFSYHHNIGYCPSHGTGGGNQALVYTQRIPTEMHKYVTIYENYFYIDDSCQGMDEGAYTNRYFLNLYDLNGAVIEKNDFRNYSTTEPIHFAAIFLKCCNKDVTTRYNYVLGRPGESTMSGYHDGACGGDGTVLGFGNQWGDRSSQGGSAWCNNTAYQNIVVNSEHCFRPGGDEYHGYSHIYNNTCINASLRGFGMDSSADYTDATAIQHEAWNNIFYNTVSAKPSDGFISVTPYAGSKRWCLDDWGYVDNNMYWGAETSRSSMFVGCWEDADSDGTKDAGEQKTFNTLTAWKAWAATWSKEQNSRNEDPLFVDATSSNYRLQGGSPALSGGRNADGYSDVLGAYITGYEQIGCSWYPSCFGYGTATATFGNVRRVDMKGVSVK